MNHLCCFLFVVALGLSACRGGDSATASPATSAATRALTLAGWDPVEGEVDLCPDITLQMPERGPRDREYLCMVSSRAWAAVTKDSALLNLTLRNASGRPPSAAVSFWRDPNGNQPPEPTRVYWLVQFTSTNAEIGISVAVDSVSGKTRAHRDLGGIILK